MHRFFSICLGMMLVGAPLSGCTCNDSSKTKPASSANLAAVSVAPTVSVAPARTPRPKQPAPEAEPFSVVTADGFHIEGSRWNGGDASAPVVLLAHRLGGTRAEWIPLIERLFPVKAPMNVVAFDLRGNGASTSIKGPMGKKDKSTWHTFDQAAFEKMDEDLSAVTAHLQKNKAGSPTSWILVGSSLGATLVTRHAAKREGDVAGLALISPGASLRGLGIYRPFGAVLRHPNLLIAGSLDSVSQEPVRLMARMSKTSQRILFEARGHSAQYLGEERWEMWDDLADWVEARVRESTLVPAASASASAPPPPLPPGTASSGP